MQYLLISITDKRCAEHHFIVRRPGVFPSFHVETPLWDCLDLRVSELGVWEYNELSEALTNFLILYGEKLDIGACIRRYFALRLAAVQTNDKP